MKLKYFLQKKKLKIRHLKIKHYTSRVKPNQNRQTCRKLKENILFLLCIQYLISHILGDIFSQEKNVATETYICFILEGFFNSSSTVFRTVAIIFLQKPWEV